MPAPPDDSDPFVSERSDRGLTTFAFGDLLFVVGPGPEGMLDRLAGVFVKALAHELGAEVAPADPG